MLEITKEVQRVGEVFDHIMTLDIAARGSISLLYNAARKKIGKPLALSAAQALAERVKPGDMVFFLTGFMVRSQFTRDASESDGPPGTASLARTIYRVLGGVPVIPVEESIANKVASVMGAAGFFPIQAEKAFEVAKPSPRPNQAVVVLPFPLNSPDPLGHAVQLIKKFSPAAVISVERGGPNDQGRVHTSQGKDVSDAHARTDLLAKYAYEQEDGPLTICVGDGGNEVGMGLIAEELEKWLPYGRKCECPCGRGIIPETKADVLVTSSVSNWGANAVAAALALLGQDPDSAPNPRLEEELIRCGARVGFIDGPTGVVGEIVDGMPAAVSASIAGLLEHAAVKGLKAVTGKKLWAVPELEEESGPGR